MSFWREESAVSRVTIAQNAGSHQVWFKRPVWAWNQVGDTHRKELLDFFNSVGATPRLAALVWSLQLRVDLEGKMKWRQEPEPFLKP